MEFCSWSIGVTDQRSFSLLPSDRWFHSADPVHAARPPDHIPPQPDPGQRRGALQLQGRGRKGSEVSAHVSSVSIRRHDINDSTLWAPRSQNCDKRHCSMKWAKALKVVLPLYTRRWQTSAASIWAAFILRFESINREKARLSRRDKEVVLVVADRLNFTQNAMPRGLYVNKVLFQVLASVDTEEEYSPSHVKTHWQTFRTYGANFCQCWNVGNFSLFQLSVLPLISNVVWRGEHVERRQPGHDHRLKVHPIFDLIIAFFSSYNRQI